MDLPDSELFGLSVKLVTICMALPELMVPL
jgi:hypothetical protein